MRDEMMWRLRVYGIVQGVGFRPFTARLAERFSIVGTVANKGSFVEINARGSNASLNQFRAALRDEAPPRAFIVNIETYIINQNNGSEFIAADFLCNDFAIVDSERQSGAVYVSPDIAICDRCRAELLDPNDRRYLHPFINCTDCGPRLTILKSMPYDRERTSMNAFKMCSRCRAEYFDSTSRRFDAQPVCCNDCGPTIKLLDSDVCDLDAIKEVRRVIVDGGIAAIKGIGGFHLACDATNAAAIDRLRIKKRRPTKPFAVMMKNIEVARRECHVDDEVAAILDGHQKPIALIEKNISGLIAGNVAPFNRKLGVMLPYTPLHILIFELPDDLADFPDALIMTSGNVSGAPIAINDDDGRALRDIADVILTHDREILIRADDSVVDVSADDLSMIRRSRGYAPLPIHIDIDRHDVTVDADDRNIERHDEVLAIGGELKNAFCLARDDLFYLSPYVGDLTDLRAVDALKSSIDHLIDLLEIEPRIVACDMHPRYHSTAIAREIAASFNVPLVTVQHHYAHLLSCMAENNFIDRVIGVAFDGTGYGLDETIWGGEILIADVDRFERFASLDPFTQAGGDRSSVDAWRSAISMLVECVGDFDMVKRLVIDLNIADESELDAQIFMISNQINCIRSTSAGRLFDAVSATLRLCHQSTYEGEAATKLQFAAESFNGSIEQSINDDRSSSAKTFNRSTDQPIYTSTIDLFDHIVKQRINGVDVNQIAYEFHVALADWIATTCDRARRSTDISTVALTGGTFQNSLLLRLTIDRLQNRGFKVLRHRSIPANDGGIALGQALAAMFKLRRNDQ